MDNAVHSAVSPKCCVLLLRCVAGKWVSVGARGIWARRWAGVLFFKTFFTCGAQEMRLAPAEARQR